ncbi:type II toxin-antitoxin system VapC family toxin [uncultured Alsobacter sp.]|uniref:type II toxin-antitoxin system VapC family toxin n=1 Tax=uncultured Alsobacter sp. TaxID=1748258 RepID=UPI002600F4E0|nr:type II toxin-antitoxin system VapC family toxin [uncultured Alsobacter sp.]
MIHLDTNAVIALMGTRQPTVRQRFDAVRMSGVPIVLSAIAFHELMYGAAASERQRENEQKLALFLAAGRIETVPFTADDAREAGDIRAFLRRSGLPIGPFDMLIAAQARRVNATLVTANTREFSRVPALNVVDWAN